MKFSKYIIKAVTIVMALFQKQHRLFFKQSYDTLRLSRCESAASAGTAQSERCLHRNQRAVSTSHNVPSDTEGNNSRINSSVCLKMMAGFYLHRFVPGSFSEENLEMA